MSNEKKQEYTLKITRANKTQLIVILYEMALTYMAEAEEAYEANNRKEFRQAISRTRGCINELMASLHFEYEIAICILQLYMFVNRELAKAEVRMDITHVDNSVKIIRELLIAYRELSLKDDSLPVMKNAQIIYSGLTYDRKDVLDSLSHSTNRGFRV
ncbi:MAG: flagellar protein FliS [Lachnospiraceae bacterium]|nr:flagellar protein FliS [Lachnospiraceae bacterium]